MKQLPPLPQPFINLDHTPGARLAWGAQMQQYALDAIADDRALNGITGEAQPARISIQEAWLLIGGNPSVQATKEELVNALEGLAHVAVEEAQPAEQAKGQRGTSYLGQAC